MIAGHIDQLPAGQGALETPAIVAGVLFIVLIITDLGDNRGLRLHSLGAAALQVHPASKCTIFLPLPRR